MKFKVCDKVKSNVRPLEVIQAYPRSFTYLCKSKTGVRAVYRGSELTAVDTGPKLLKTGDHVYCILDGQQFKVVEEHHHRGIPEVRIKNKDNYSLRIRADGLLSSDGVLPVYVKMDKSMQLIYVHIPEVPKPEIKKGTPVLVWGFYKSKNELHIATGKFTLDGRIICYNSPSSSNTTPWDNWEEYKY